MTFGEKLRYYRTQKRMTQFETAKAAGISRRTYLYYESGEKYPRSRDTIRVLADIFGVETNALLPEDDNYVFSSFKSLPVEEQAELLKGCAELFFNGSDVSDEQKLSVYNSLSGLYLSSVPHSENDSQT